jgi:hypothetical protein
MQRGQSQPFLLPADGLPNGHVNGDTLAVLGKKLNPVARSGGDAAKASYESGRDRDNRVVRARHAPAPRVCILDKRSSRVSRPLSRSRARGSQALQQAQLACTSWTSPPRPRYACERALHAHGKERAVHLGSRRIC